MNELGKKIALEEAANSPCKKRKVGAAILNIDGAGNAYIAGRGHNYALDPDGGCEDDNGNTFPSVIHAEVAAILNADPIRSNSVMYVTHKPCDNCQRAIEDAGITQVIIVSDFMKFDTGKLRYSLIPTVFLKALASVLTYGAKKYKPNNWQEVDNIDRYWDALYRHLEAARGGEVFDSESNLPHLWHAFTNIGFILFLDDKKQAQVGSDTSKNNN